MIQIRDPRETDKTAWKLLWAGYNDFYKASVEDQVTEATWAKIMDDGKPVFARVAEQSSGQIVGFTVNVLHECTWTIHPVCYLEDLFVAPDMRNRGIGRALIQDLVDLCKENVWPRLYWHTESTNSEGRFLYDKFVEADNFVRYRLFFE